MIGRTGDKHFHMEQFHTNSRFDTCKGKSQLGINLFTNEMGRQGAFAFAFPRVRCLATQSTPHTFANAGCSLINMIYYQQSPFQKDQLFFDSAAPEQGFDYIKNCLILQVFRAPPGRTLSVHFRSIAGREFELNVTDRSAHNHTLLINITDEYNGKVVKTASSSVLELSFYSKGTSRDPANLEMIIVEDQGT